MKGSYRLNVRFDLRKEPEREAVEYLVKLSESGSQTRNRFIVEAVTEAIRRKESGSAFSLDDIRAVFREELQSVSFASTPKAARLVKTEFTEKEQEANDASVLSALAMFD